MSRKALLWAGPLLAAAGFALWVMAPSYWVFALGFLLWGAKGALASGAFEALVYEELDRLGAADRYARIIGRTESAGLAGAMVAIGVAAPVFAWGGYAAVGAASVLACLAASAVAATLPEGGRGGEADYLENLRGGLREMRADRALLAALLLVPAVSAIWGALDEFTPLLAAGTGVADSTVPLLMLVIWVGATAGGLLGPAGERLGTGGLAALLLAGGVALAAGAATRSPAGFGLVAVAFCAFQLATVVADARLQHRITGPSRATVTSFAGLATDASTIAVYGGYGVLASRTGHAAAFTLCALPYLLIAAHLTLRRRNP